MSPVHRTPKNIYKGNVTRTTGSMLNTLVWPFLCYLRSPSLQISAPTDTTEGFTAMNRIFLSSGAPPLSLDLDPCTALRTPSGVTIHSQNRRCRTSATLSMFLNLRHPPSRPSQTRRQSRARVQQARSKPGLFVRLRFSLNDLVDGAWILLDARPAIRTRISLPLASSVMLNNPYILDERLANQQARGVANDQDRSSLCIAFPVAASLCFLFSSFRLSLPTTALHIAHSARLHVHQSRTFTHIHASNQHSLLHSFRRPFSIHPSVSRLHQIPKVSSLLQISPLLTAY